MFDRFFFGHACKRLRRRRRDGSHRHRTACQLGRRTLACEMLESRRLLAIDATLSLSANQDASAASATSNTAPAISFQLLHSLGANPDDGDAPMRAPLVAVGSKLYGMTNEGGTNNEGTVFSVNDDGSNFQVLHSFTWTSTAPLDGALPGLSSGLTVIGSTLFGTTEQGGIANNGALFSMNLDGSGFQILHSFMGGSNDGATPDAAPILVGSVLYGTTRSGGSAGDGTVYSINTDGSNYQIVHTFLGGASDGALPYTELTQVGSLLYGTTTAGGSANLGTAFSMNLDGSNFQVLYSFSSNGFYGPSSQLIVVGSEMYGVSVPGGTNDSGIVYAMNLNGSNFQILHSFTDRAGDGEYPGSNLILTGSTLYGTTVYGGADGDGTVFSIKTDGSNYQVLHSLSTSEGDGVYASVTAVGSTLYGLGSGGGTLGGGTLFSLSTDGSDFQVEHNFFSDGSQPRAALVADGSTLFGTTSNGINGNGPTLFAVDDDGTNPRVLHTFSSSQGTTSVGTLILIGQTLYGEAAGSLSGSNGFVFSINTDGSNFQILYWFTGGSQGQYGASGLTLVGSTLYGTAGGGGNMANVVFSLNLDGSGFKTLHQFPTSFSLVPSGSITAELTLAGSTIIGTTNSGGSNGDGEIFSMNLDGSNFRVLHPFSGGANDGSSAMGGVTLVGSTLMGTTTGGGTDNDGTIYSLNLDGSYYQVLHSFTGGPNDGSDPQGRLLLIGSTLYGTTVNGGSSGKGIAYSVDGDGSNFQVLYNFNSAANPSAALTLVGSTLYGTSSSGGTGGNGAVFSLTRALPPGPQVTDVFVDGTTWSPSYLSALVTAGHGNGNGYQIPVGTDAQLTDVPWTNLNQMQIVFNEDVDVTENSLVVAGVSASQYPFSGFSYDSATHTATWTLAAPIRADKITLDLQSTGPNAVTDAYGDSLDGEWTNGTSNYPSGDGQEGGDFNFAFNVLPADMNQDGIVNGLDIADFASHWLQVGGLTGDANGDNIVNGLDIAAIASHWLATLPAGGAGAGSEAATIIGGQAAGGGAASIATASSALGSTSVSSAANSASIDTSASSTLRSSGSLLVSTPAPGFLSTQAPDRIAAFIGRPDVTKLAATIDQVLSEGTGAEP